MPSFFAALGGRMAWMTWLITSLFYAFQFFLRSSPNAMSDQLMATFQIDAQMLGIFTAVYYWMYASLQIPIGILLDVWGPKRLLRLGTTLCVFGAVVFSFAPTLAIALGGRALIGAGAAVSFIGSIRMNTLWFPPAQMAFIIGLLSSMGKCGGALANACLPWLISTMGSWQVVLATLCGLGTVAMILIWIFVKNGPQDTFVSAVPNFATLKREFTGVALSSLIWKVGIYGYAMYLTLSVFSDTYSIAFLKQLLDIPTETAGNMASLVPLGSCLGAAIISYTSDYVKKRLIFLRISAFLTFACSSFIFFFPSPPTSLIAIALFLFGFFSGGQILVYAVATEGMPPYLAGMATGMVNAILMLGGSLHNPLVGTIIKGLWNGSYTATHAPLYTLSNYRWGLASLSVFFFIAVLLAFYIPETHPHLSKRSST